LGQRVVCRIEPVDINEAFCYSNTESYIHNHFFMNLWHDISVGDNAPEEFNCIIEIPKGSHNKYEIDKETGLITLDRVLHTSQQYPVDYGFIPQTLWDDGDAVDVVLLTTAPLYPGILVKVRPVAIMDMMDDGESDAKILAVPVKDPRWDAVQDVSDVNRHTVKEVKHFFETYKNLQQKKVDINAVDGKQEAVAAIVRGMKLYNEKFGK